MPLDLIDEYNPMDLRALAKPLMKTDIAISFDERHR